MNKNIKNEIKEILGLSITIPFLFIGTGLSRRYINVEDWKALLSMMAKKTLNSEFAFEIYSNKAKKKVGSEKNKLYPQIATLIEFDFNEKWYVSDKYKEKRKKYSDLVKNGISPFKIEIAEYFANKAESLKEIKNKNLKNEINLLKKIGENNINGIITTNYDTMLEKLFPDYKVYTGQHELIFSPIQGVGEIYKIHGCCTKPNTIVINKDDYDNFNSKNAYLSAKLLTIFLEHPIIFIGYSLNDDNINSILSSITNCLTQKQLLELKNRLIFVEWNNTDLSDNISMHSKTFHKNKRLEMTKLFLKDFSILYEAILENKAKSRYSISVLRKLKKDIYELILTNDPEEKLRVLTPLSENNGEKTEYVIGVGILKEFGIKGMIGIKPEDVYKDIIFNNLCSYPDFNIDLFITEVLPDLLNLYSNSIPIYKYIYYYSNSFESLPNKIKENIKYEYDDFLNSSLRKNRIDKTIYELREEYGDLTALKYIAKIEKENMDPQELYEYLKDILNENPDILSIKNKDRNQKINLRRLIKIYDWLIYFDKIKAKEHF